MLATKHVAPSTGVERQVDARSCHAGRSQAALLLARHAGTMGALGRGFQQCLNMR